MKTTATPPRRWRPRVACALLAFGTALCLPAAAADDSGALHRALVEDSEVLLHLRSYYFDRHKPADVVNAAWAAGGWLGYTSGWLGDRVRVGAVAYTSQPIWAPDDTSGSLLLGPDQQAISVIGQAWVSLKLAEQVLTGGRFEVTQPEVNPNDVRMIPNTFEGGNLSGSIGSASGTLGATGIGYYAAYLNEMKTIASERFVNFATVAGAPAGISSPLWLLGFEAAPVADSKVRLSSYYVPDILTSSYADGEWLTTLSPTYKLRLGAQAMYQSSNGSNALTGSSFGTGVGGIKADLIAGPATFTMAYNQTGRGANYRAPYGGWAGYTFMIVQSFNRAGEKALLIGGAYDFAAIGVPGLELNAYIVNGRDVIDPANGAPLPDTTEYDLTLAYRFTAAHWPVWARPLWVRARAAYVDQGAAGETTDYRIIINYPWVLR